MNHPTTAVNTPEQFNRARRLHYTQAKFEGNWYTIGHFDDEHAPMVWIEEAHGNMSGYVMCNCIEAWAPAQPA